MAEDTVDNPFEFMKAEQVNPVYFNGSLIKPDYTLTRLNCPAGRIYFTFENDEPTFYSGTGAIERELPKNENLEEAMADQGYAPAKRKMNKRMLAGSFLHSRFADLGMNGVIDFDLLPEMLAKYYFDQNFFVLDTELNALSKEICKDLIGIQEWIRRHNVEFIGIEYPVYSKELSMATQLDAWVMMDLFEGSGAKMKTERVMAIIDLKIGKWGHSTGHKYQLYSGLQMLLERYPQFAEHKIHLFNLTGKAFRTLDWNMKTFPFKLTDQTDKIDMMDYNLTVAKAQNHMEERLNKKFMTITGKMGVMDDPKKFIVHKTIRDFVREGDWRRFIKTSASIAEIAQV
jgi:hypothetical protein